MVTVMNILETFTKMNRIPVILLAAFFCLSSMQLAHAAGIIRVVVYGDSLTSGYQLTEEDSYASKLRKKLQEVGYTNVEVVNMSVAGESTSGGLERLSSLLLKQPDIVVLQLGGNDVIRGVSPNLIYHNLIHIIGRLKENNVYVVLIGMKAPPNMGSEYVQQVESIYQRMANFYNLAFYPSALEGIFGYPELNLADGIHPNSKGIDVMVENTYRLVDAGLRWKWEVLQYQEEYRRRWEQDTSENLPAPVTPQPDAAASTFQQAPAAPQ